jgi:hypothetical protein
MTMDRIDLTMRAARWALLPAVATIALLATVPARAADQQTTDEEKIYALSQEVAGVGSYAQAPTPAPVVRHRHQSPAH